MWRNQVEENYFKIGFLEELNPTLSTKLTDLKFYQTNKFELRSARKEMKTYKNELNKKR